MLLFCVECSLSIPELDRSHHAIRKVFVYCNYWLPLSPLGSIDRWIFVYHANILSFQSKLWLIILYVYVSCNICLIFLPTMALFASEENRSYFNPVLQWAGLNERHVCDTTRIIQSLFFFLTCSFLSSHPRHTLDAKSVGTSVVSERLWTGTWRSTLQKLTTTSPASSARRGSRNWTVLNFTN